MQNSNVVSNYEANMYIDEEKQPLVDQITKQKTIDDFMMTDYFLFRVHTLSSSYNSMTFYDFP